MSEADRQPAQRGQALRARQTEHRGAARTRISRSPQGEFVALMGPSGSGKTTLLNLIGGLDTPSSGRDHRRRPASRPTGQRRPRALARQSRRLRVPVLQSDADAERAAQRGAAAAADAPCRPRSARRNALAALTLVGIADRARHKPNELSGGQAQRVAIARALVADPTLLVCDEPTGDLDRKSADEVLHLLQDAEPRARQEHHHGHPRPQGGRIRGPPAAHGQGRAARGRDAGAGRVRRGHEVSAAALGDAVAQEDPHDLHLAVDRDRLPAVRRAGDGRLRVLAIRAPGSPAPTSSSPPTNTRSRCRCPSPTRSRSARCRAWPRSPGSRGSAPTTRNRRISCLRCPSTPTPISTCTRTNSSSATPPMSAFSRHAQRRPGQRRADEEIRLEGRRQDSAAFDHLDAEERLARLELRHRRQLRRPRTRPSSRSRPTLLFHYELFDEGRSFGKGNVGWFEERVTDPREAAAIAGRIDALFANSPDETKTQPAKDFAMAFIKQFGDIGFVLRAIFGCPGRIRGRPTS